VPIVSTENGYIAAGAEIPTDHPIMEEVKASYQAATNHSPIVSGRMGAADTRFLIRTGNTPTVIFGPGSTAQMYAMNEFVPIENVITCTKALTLAMFNWCDGRQ
jgi:acetylornithine deacetylase